MGNIRKKIKTQEELLAERKNGKLPVVEIVNHPFYVDVRMETLRPHDDFSTRGIPFDAFHEYEESDDFAWIPYCPKKHELKQVDLSKLTAIPQDWIIVEILHPSMLDPYGWARENELNIEEFLENNPLREGVKARIVPWSETHIHKLIERNKERLELKTKRLYNQPGVNAKKAEIKQGRRR